jgi:hypothetical protein
MNSNLQSSIDHIVIVSPSLDVGVNYVYETLGVTPQKGGIHIKMGTHNALLKLGNSTYLEVLAINPELPKPGRPRWFSLDKLSPDAKPKLLTWVASTNDISRATKISSLTFGNIEAMNRADLNWLITIPADGSLPCDGIAPSLIQWMNEPHPASRIPYGGCSLIRIEAFHPDATAINDTLHTIGLNGNYSISLTGYMERPFLVAYIQTPNGICKFES